MDSLRACLLGNPYRPCRVGRIEVYAGAGDHVHEERDLSVSSRLEVFYLRLALWIPPTSRELRGGGSRAIGKDNPDGENFL